VARIIIDLNHPCDLNFFKFVINRLSIDQEIKIFLTVLRRGILPKLVEAEFPNYNIKYFSRHRGNVLSIIFEANIIKFFQLLIYTIKVKPIICISFGSFILGAVCKILRIKNIQFYDDPENKKNIFLQKLTADILYYPFFLKSDKKIKTFNALKEWAYLSPDYFQPNIRILTKYGIEPKRYIFIREVSTKTINYRGQKSNQLNSLRNYIPPNIQVLLSLEDKSKIDLYPKDWILLNEPVDDIHSLIYFSQLLISSGDSMAREGAILGVPSIYTGNREMGANEVLKNYGTLFHYELKEFFNLLSSFCKLDYDKEKTRKILSSDFVDLVNFIMDSIYFELESSAKNFNLKFN